VLPVVPSYITFITGYSLEELRDGTVGDARRAALVHSLAFGLGFGLVFLTLGLAATALGQSINRSLPMVTRIGGGLVVLFGLYLLGVFRIAALQRDWRLHLPSKPAGVVGSALVGVAFGAGWTPCIGPVLGTILLYAGLEATALQGMALLAAYGLGLGIPFVVAAVAFNWFLVSLEGMRRWVAPLEKLAGTLLIVVGVLMMTGRFAALSAILADMGQLIDLEP
jgi:cytochrome c-type biogenesis protein